MGVDGSDAFPEIVDVRAPLCFIQPRVAHKYSDVVHTPINIGVKELIDIGIDRYDSIFVHLRVDQHLPPPPEVQ